MEEELLNKIKFLEEENIKLKLELEDTKEHLHLFTFQTPKFSANHVYICFWDYIA
jgi:hypothetical protein